MCSLDKIGFGTYRVKDKNIIINALNQGYKTIDTAVLYKNHNIISDAINELKINRETLFIISKIHNNDQLNEKIYESYTEMIKYFGGYVDLLLLHSPVKDKFIDSWKVLEELYINKKVRYIGVSNFRINEIKQLLSVCRIKPYLNQIEVSPFNIRAELISYCRDNNIIIQAYSSLTNKMKLNNLVLRELAEKYKISVAQLLLKWALQQNYYVIPMSTNSHHIAENLLVNKINDLSKDDIIKLNALNEKFYTITHYKD